VQITFNIGSCDRIDVQDLESTTVIRLYHLDEVAALYVTQASAIELMHQIALAVFYDDAPEVLEP
jgi:hypothetical protein